MEYCITTNFDLLDTAKLLSPWLLAWAVYKVWHYQKEKEVIANEAKDILKLIDDLKLSYTMIYVQYHIYKNNIELFDSEKFKEYQDKEKMIQADFNLKMKFLLTLIEDIKISKIYTNYELNEAKFSATPMIYENKNEELVETLKIVSERLEIDLNNLKLELANYAMYKNKIYTKSV